MLQCLKYMICTKFWGMDIHPTVKFDASVKFDRTYPKGVHVGANTYIGQEAVILSHDMTRGLYLHTRIGENCIIGARCIVMPGVTIGNNVKIQPGSVVTKDVPQGMVVSGNPAMVQNV